jgi:iron(III) transport system permease protein
LVTRSGVRGARLWRVALALPLAIPTYLAGYAWIAAVPGIRDFWAANLVLVACSYPYVYLPVLAALGQVDRAHEDVARSLGRSPMNVFLTVTMPQIRRSVAAGALLTALYVLSDFGAVGSMRYQAFTWEIFQSYRAGFNADRAASLSLILVVGAAALVCAELSSRGRSTQRSVRSAMHSDRLGWSRGGRLGASMLLSTVLAVAVVFPVVSVSRWFVRGREAGVEWGELGRALAASARYAVLASVVTSLLALVVAISAARSNRRLDRLAEALTYLTHSLPSVVIGISMIYLSLRVVPGWYQRTPVLIAAYTLLFLPLAVASTRSAIERCPTPWEETARSLGVGAWRTLARVTLRVAAPGLAAGAALTALATMKELPTTLLLHPTGTDTLAMELWNKMGVSDVEGAAPYALALVLFAAVPTAVLGWFASQRDHDRS